MSATTGSHDAIKNPNCCTCLESELAELRYLENDTRKTLDSAMASIYSFNEQRNEWELLKGQLEAENTRLREALVLAIEVAEDAVNQHRYNDGSPSYFDEKWGWSENIKKAKDALEGR